MIVFDTSALRSVGFPHDAALTMILQLAGQAGQRVALPDVVLREYLSHHRHDLTTKIKVAQDAVQNLLGSLDEWPNRETWRFLDYPDVDLAMVALNHRLNTKFHVLTLSDAAAKGGLFREIDRKAPASTDPARKGFGARDATIWLTTLEQCAAFPGEQILLVSNDGDFGGSTLRPELASEAPANLVYCHGLAAVLKHLADPDDTAAGEARKVMSTSKVRQAVRKVIDTYEVREEVYDALPAAAFDLQWPADLEQLHLEEPDAKRIHGFRRGDNLFASGELWWRAARRHRAPDGQGGTMTLEVRFWVRMTILVMMRSDGAIRGIQVIHRKPISRVEVDQPD